MKKYINMIGITLVVVCMVGLGFWWLKPNPAYADFTPSEPVTNEKVVLDNRTGLMWEVKQIFAEDFVDNNMTIYNFVGALGFCDSLNHAGYMDWRLPNVKELNSIFDVNTNSGALIDTSMFPNTQPSYYWSSTTSASDTNDAWQINFSNGVLTEQAKSTTNYARCVR